MIKIGTVSGTVDFNLNLFAHLFFSEILLGIHQTFLWTALPRFHLKTILLLKQERLEYAHPYVVEMAFQIELFRYL